MQAVPSRCGVPVRRVFNASRGSAVIDLVSRSQIQKLQHQRIVATTPQLITSASSPPRRDIRSIMSAPVKKFANKASKASAPAVPSSSSSSTTLACIQTNKSGQLLLHVEAKPGVKSGDEGLFLNPAESSPSILVRIDAQPVEGEANRAIQALLSSELSLRKTAVKLISGDTNKFKCFAIDADADKGGAVKVLTSQILSERLRAKLTNK